MTLSAEELYRRGVELSNSRRYAPARRALLAATSRTPNPDLKARIAGTLAYVTAQTGDPSEAERLCREALASNDVEPSTVAVLSGQLGTLMMHAGRIDEAVTWLDRGILNSDDPVAIANMRTNRGMVELERLDLDAADAHFRAAAAEYAQQGMDVYEARVRHNLGYTALLRGDLVRALAEMRDAFPAFARESAVSGAIGELDQAEVLRDAGLATEAEQTLERVARTFGAHGMRQARGETEFQLARALLLHDPARAAKVAAAAVRRFRALRSESWAARALSVQQRAQLATAQARTDGRTGAGRRGRPDAENARPAARTRAAAPVRVPPAAEIEANAAELDRLGFAADAAALRLSLDLWRARHPAPAVSEGSASAQPAGRLPRNAPIQVRLLSHEVRAARASAAGRNGEAARHAGRGLDALAQWQQSFGSLDLQTSLTMHGQGLMLEGTAAALRSRRPELVFEWSERARHLSQQVVPLRPPPDPELAADLATLRALRAEDPGWLGNPKAAAIADRARDRQWVATGSAGHSERVRLAELQATLDADTAFLSYVFDGLRLGCLVVTDDDASLVGVPEVGELRSALAGLRADLDMSAAVRTGPMAAVVARSLQNRLARLARLLTDAPLAVAGDRRLVLTAPGLLSGLPWSMLPGLRERPSTLAASATNWVRDRGRVPRREVGFAVGPGVRRGEEEVTLAASSWPVSTSLLAGAATVGAVTEMAGGVGVLHLAAHGRHAVDNPLFSGLELADGTLFGYDIDQMPQVPDVVILSACELGRSTVRWGEEAIGMTRAWLHAGAACVVAAPVVVADDLACELLGAMHAELAAGYPPSEALARAGLRTGASAPFQCHGSGF